MRTYILSLAAVAAFGPLTAGAVPIQWADNGHSYETIAVDGGITWADARATAESLGGHLATITSAAENDFIVDYLSIGPVAYWLGGFQESGPAETDPKAGWQWVTGEAFTYTNWAAGEANDLGGNEDALAFAFFSPGNWNDAPLNHLYSDARSGFVVEYTKVPEPGVLALLGAALAGAALRRRRNIGRRGQGAA